MELGEQDEQAFAACRAAGLYDALLGAFCGEDLLTKLATLELVSKLGSFPRGSASGTRFHAGGG